MQSSLQKCVATIKAEKPYVGRKPYSHNIISINLRIIDKEYGTEAANKVIRDLGLARLGWDEQEIVSPPWNKPDTGE